MMEQEKLKLTLIKEFFKKQNIKNPSQLQFDEAEKAAEKQLTANENDERYIIDVTFRSSPKRKFV